jgi:hypothetical protein
MDFYCFRIHLHSASITENMNFDESQSEPIAADRETFITQLFERDIDLSDNDSDYYYSHESTVGNYVGGVFGKPKSATHNLGPESDWAYGETPDWDPHVLIVDPTEHNDGQKLFLEARGGSTHKRFADHLAHFANQRLDCPWTMKITHLSDEVQLSDIFLRYPNQIARLVIEFPPVNMPTNVDSPLNAARQLFGEAQAQMAIVLEAEQDNIEVTQEVVEDAVAMGAATGSVIKAYKTREAGERVHQKLYDSNEIRFMKKISVALENTLSNLPSQISEIIRRISGQ